MSRTGTVILIAAVGIVVGLVAWDRLRFWSAPVTRALYLSGSSFHWEGDPLATAAFLSVLPLGESEDNAVESLKREGWWCSEPKPVKGWDRICRTEFFPGLRLISLACKELWIVSLVVGDDHRITRANVGRGTACL